MAADVTHDKGIKRRRMETFKVELWNLSYSIWRSKNYREQFLEERNPATCQIFSSAFQLVSLAKRYTIRDSSRI